jgi:hypothetical protein
MTKQKSHRTDQEIVDQTEKLAVWLLSWCFNHQPETLTPMRESAHPFAQRCWSAACHIQEMLTNTDPENAVAELDVAHSVSESKPLAAYVIGCFSAAEAEGLQDVLAETTDKRLKDLVERRLMHAFYAAQNTAPPQPCHLPCGDIKCAAICKRHAEQP